MTHVRIGYTIDNIYSVTIYIIYGYTIGCLAILGIYPRWLLIRHEGGARGPYQ